MEKLLLAVIVALIGGSVCVFGLVAAHQRVDLAMLHHTKENTEPEIWKRCHRFVGKGFTFVGIAWLLVA